MRTYLNSSWKRFRRRLDRHRFLNTTYLTVVWLYRVYMLHHYGSGKSLYTNTDGNLPPNQMQTGCYLSSLSPNATRGQNERRRRTTRHNVPSQT